MGHRYTDVDHLILKRWDEVRDLRSAFDDLLDRMGDVIESALGKVTAAANEKGFTVDVNIKRPSIWFWKPGWATRRGEAGVYLEVFDFAPSEYGKEVDDHPSIWLMTDQFARLKIRESSEDFGRVVKAALSSELQAKWSRADVKPAEYPLGRNCVEVSEADRIRMVGHPEELVRFVLDCFDESTELVPAIDQALQQMTRR
jgi:hypothetical protein